jgi:hypothetical protein
MTPYRAILGVIALERFAWYCFIGMLALWKSSAAVGTLLFRPSTTSSALASAHL